MVVDSDLVELAYSVVSVRVMTNNWLQTARVDSCCLADDTNQFVLRLVFWNYHVAWRVVFFVAH